MTVYEIKKEIIAQIGGVLFDRVNGYIMDRLYSGKRGAVMHNVLRILQDGGLSDHATLSTMGTIEDYAVLILGAGE